MGTFSSKLCKSLVWKLYLHKIFLNLHFSLELPKKNNLRTANSTFYNDLKSTWTQMATPSQFLPYLQQPPSFRALTEVKESLETPLEDLPASIITVQPPPGSSETLRYTYIRTVFERYLEVLEHAIDVVQHHVGAWRDEALFFKVIGEIGKHMSHEQIDCFVDERGRGLSDEREWLICVVLLIIDGCAVLFYFNIMNAVILGRCFVGVHASRRLLAW